MAEMCDFPVDTKACGNAAQYTFILEGPKGIDGGQRTNRCKNHMAGNILKMELTDAELMTIEKF